MVTICMIQTSKSTMMSSRTLVWAQFHDFLERGNKTAIRPEMLMLYLGLSLIHLLNLMDPDRCIEILGHLIYPILTLAKLQLNGR